MHGFPRSISNRKPHTYTCIAILLLIVIQVSINYVQSRTNKRLLLPRCLLKGRFNTVEIHTLAIGDQDMGECPICLVSLSSRVDDSEVLDSEIHNCIPHTIRLIRTPCNHRYHVGCLRNWMEHKLECPVDRKQLTPMIME